jgi:hypothetical protein
VVEEMNELLNETTKNMKTVEWHINNASRLSCKDCENLRDDAVGNSCLLKIFPSICKLSILNELVDNEYDYKLVKIQKHKPRTWKCECGTTLISYPLDADTFMRIGNFTGCPICGCGTLVKTDT